MIRCSAICLTGTNLFFPPPEVEVVIRKNVGVTKSEVKNQVVILEVIVQPENMIVIKTVDVFIKILGVNCL